MPGFYMRHSIFLLKLIYKKVVQEKIRPFAWKRMPYCLYLMCISMYIIECNAAGKARHCIGHASGMALQKRFPSVNCHLSTVKYLNISTLVNLLGGSKYNPCKPAATAPSTLLAVSSINMVSAGLRPCSLMM